LTRVDVDWSLVFFELLDESWLELADDEAVDDATLDEVPLPDLERDLDELDLALL